MRTCPIIPSMTWFSKASQSINSLIWNCSAPDGRGHYSNKPTKECQYAIKIATRKLTGYPNIHHMCQMTLEALHSLRQLGGIGIWGGERGFKWEGNDVWHVGMKNWMMKPVCLYTNKPCCPSPKPHSGTNYYWPSHHDEKSNLAPLQKTFFNHLLGNWLGTLYKKLFSLHLGIIKDP